MNPSNDDCYFYYYSTCTKGNECPYRHCEAALGTETVCTAWKSGFCLRPNCKFRHMESKIKRTAIPCYWENQPGGCRKPHCVFFHQKTKNGLSEDNALILPMSGQSPQQSPVYKDQSDANNSLSANDKNDSDLLSPSISVEPVVVTLNDGEESDTESMTSTPVKLTTAITSAIPGRSLFINADSDDIGIKTLEQLRMERIHRESAHFYNSVYDAPALESVPVELNKSPIYQRDLSENDDLRALLKRKQGCKSEVYLPDKEASKRVINFKRAKIDHDSNSTSLTITFNKGAKTDSVPKPRDFQIKTLDEIRKAKNKKENTFDYDISEKKEQSVVVVDRRNKEKVQITSQMEKTLKLKRPAQEIYHVKSPLKNGRHSVKSELEQCTEAKKVKSEDGCDPVIRTKDSQAKENVVKSSLTSRRILHLKKSPPSDQGLKKDDDQINKKSPTKLNTNERNTLDDFKSFLRHPLSQLEGSKNAKPLPEKNSPAADAQDNIETNGIDNSVRLNSTEKQASNDLPSISVLSETADSCMSSKETDFQIRDVTRTTSVDEFEQLLLESDAELDDHDTDADGGEKTEDIFLELEEMLKS